MEGLYANGFSAIDIPQVLNYGIIGLGFLLALLSFWLMRGLQRQESVNRNLFGPVYAYMVFSVIVIALGLVSEFMRSNFDISRSVGEAKLAAIQKSHDDIVIKNAEILNYLEKYRGEITAQIDDVGVSVEVCRSYAHGASTNTGDAEGCTNGAIQAMNGALAAQSKLGLLRGSVLGLNPP